MAKVEWYRGQRLKIGVANEAVQYDPQGGIIDMPAIIQTDGSVWVAATIYLRRKSHEAEATGASQKTVEKHAAALASYCSFLETEDLQWNEIPKEKSQRPTYRYRGHVMRRINASELARSTGAHNMSVIRAFYLWAIHTRILDATASEPFINLEVTVRITNRFGLERSLRVLTSDLAIRRNTVAQKGVEEGCIPIKISDRNKLLLICEEYFRLEFCLFMKCGFFSGMRNGSIINLTHKALRNHFPSSEIPGWYAISIGPEYGIATKGGVTYHPSMPEPLLRELLQYCMSVRRLARVKKADNDLKDLIFLNQFGKPLTTRSFGPDMTKLRLIAKSNGLRLQRFYFHCTRATFGTAFVIASLKAGHKSNWILPRLMRLMGHSTAQSSMGYIDFVEDDHIMESDINAYSDFLDLPRERTF
ncbi:hypothetical protein ACTXPD_16465 [Vreelandella alkaliphila]|uniref:site-specific integrase n=1 Tax=Halomonadaceae TaxID=28256 RepID=UPI000E8B3001|nr:site-specific integrase [Halomonas sp. 3D7M]HBS82383.1 hypothetical protein [Halomonas campaniensis]